METERLEIPDISKPILLFLVAIFALALLRSAWVTEDAYITLRTVDNFVNGYGLTWNPSERVQTFTHPLWLFLITFLYFFTREGFYTILFLCLTVSIATFGVVAFYVKNHNLATLAILIILIFSKAFIDYSTSGLENPLTHLLIAIFLLIIINRSNEELESDRTALWLGLISGLATLDRMDVILFFIPALLYIVLKSSRKAGTIKSILIGYIPFLLWEIFAVIYYGFPFPNTAYAKLNNGIPEGELIKQGFLYILNSLNWDPITFMAILAATFITLWKRSWKEISIVAGMLLYIAYVVWIGGDYMSGRFFSAALLVSVILLMRDFQGFGSVEGILVLAFVFALGFASPTPTLISVSDQTFSTGRTDLNQIHDERSFYFQASGLLFSQRNAPPPYHDWAFRGMILQANGRKFVVLDNVGFAGYFAGPTVHIVDRLAIADPFLARLKPIQDPNWMAGHFEREIPEGYVETLKSGQDRMADTNLGQYYQKLSSIISGNIWNWDRFVTIWKMNTGQYDYLLKTYQP